MIGQSPATLQLKRRLLRQSSTLAFGEALKEAVPTLPHGKLRRMISGKAKRAETCGTSQHHRMVKPKDGPSYVLSSNQRECHCRGCMSYEARRANALAADTIDLMEYVWNISPGARVLMLTLTSVNRPLVETRAMLLDHQKALKAFWGFERLLTATLGHFTNIEVDFENRRGDIYAHVHSHSLGVVEKGALSDHRYMRQAEWVALWQRALKADYKPNVWITAIKSRDRSSTDPDSIRGAVREVCKYCLDTEGFISHEHGDLRIRPDVAVAFTVATYRRRLTSMDRIFNQAKKLRATRRKAAAQPPSGE